MAGVVAAIDEPSPSAPIGTLAAPGRDVPTTLSGSRWATVSGASYAAAHVSGLLALMIELRRRSGRDSRLAASDLVVRRGRPGRCLRQPRLAPAPDACAPAARRQRWNPSPGTDVRRGSLRRGRQLTLAALCLGASLAARAQLGATVAAESDYRFRGVSLNDSGPTLRAAFNYDAAERLLRRRVGDARRARARRPLCPRAGLRRLRDTDRHRPACRGGRHRLALQRRLALRLRGALRRPARRALGRPDPSRPQLLRPGRLHRVRRIRRPHAARRELPAVRPSRRDREDRRQRRRREPQRAPTCVSAPAGSGAASTCSCRGSPPAAAGRTRRSTTAVAAAGSQERRTRSDPRCAKWHETVARRTVIHRRTHTRRRR